MTARLSFTARIAAAWLDAAVFANELAELMEHEEPRTRWATEATLCEQQASMVCDLALEQDGAMGSGSVSIADPI